MYENMYLVIEKNRLRNRFGRTVTTTVLEILNKERNENGLVINYLVTKIKGRKMQWDC